MAGKKQSQNNEPKKTLTDDLFDVLNPNNILNNAQRVLSSAVNVLETEIAAGILAAKKIEKKVLNVDDVRSNPENLLNRIRKDTHEVVDLFLDGFIALSSQLKTLTDSVAQQTNNVKFTEAPVEKKQNEVTILQPDEPVKPGDITVLYMNIADDDSVAPVKIQLQKKDLEGSYNQKIPLQNISIRPATILLQPGDNKEVVIRIKIPAACKRGHYTALFTDLKNPLIKAIVNIEVA